MTDTPVDTYLNTRVRLSRGKLSFEQWRDTLSTLTGNERTRHAELLHFVPCSNTWVPEILTLLDSTLGQALPAPTRQRLLTTALCSQDPLTRESVLNRARDPASHTGGDGTLAAALLTQDPTQIASRAAEIVAQSPVSLVAMLHALLLTGPQNVTDAQSIIALGRLHVGKKFPGGVAWPLARLDTTWVSKHAPAIVRARRAEKAALFNALGVSVDEQRHALRACASEQLLGTDWLDSEVRSIIPNDLAKELDRIIRKAQRGSKKAPAADRYAAARTWLDERAKGASKDKGLAHATWLHLYGSGALPSLEPLKEAVALKTLGINGGTLDDLLGVAQAPALTDLSIGSGVKIKDWSALASMTQLRTLSVAVNLEQIAAVIPPNVTSLTASARGIKNLSCVRSLSNLTMLSLSDCTELESLDDLVHLGSLSTLQLYGRIPLDLTPLEQCASLEALLLGTLSPTHTLDAIGRCTKLKSLGLSGCPIADLRPLAALSNLESLTLNKSIVTDLSPLALCTRLRTLDIQHSKVRVITPISLLGAMESLNLSYLNIRDIAALQGLSNLTQLQLYGCKHLTDLSPLRGLVKLEHLDVSRTGVADLSALAGLPLLAWLSLRSSAVNVDQPATKKLIDTLSGRGCRVMLGWS